MQTKEGGADHAKIERREGPAQTEDCATNYNRDDENIERRKIVGESDADSRCYGKTDERLSLAPEQRHYAI